MHFCVSFLKRLGCSRDHDSDAETGPLPPLLSNIHARLDDLRLSSTHPSSDGEGESRRGVLEELQALAKELARVETTRNYTGHACGVLYIRGLKLTKDVLSLVITTHPHWIKLVSEVDHRIDRTLAILRPQAIADHRTLLASLGWPPSLSTLSSPYRDIKGPSSVNNPLFTMPGDLKLQYCESFLALCGLHQLEGKRKYRQLEEHYDDGALHQPLWVVEELVNPLSIASQRHFSKWMEKPECIFGLVYKIIREYVDSIDDLLQPLVDEATLSGYSCREGWVSAMVCSLSTYMAKEVIPINASKVEEESKTAFLTQARVSWPHLVDLMIKFDKQVQSLAAHSGMPLSLQEEGNMSLLVVFCDRPDWLHLWAEIELDKLNSELKVDMNWINTRCASYSSTW